MKLSDRESAALAVGLCVGTVIGLVSMGISHHQNSRAFQKQAIDAGAAEWTIDAKTGEIQFIWNEKGTP